MEREVNAVCDRTRDRIKARAESSARNAETFAAAKYPGEAMRWNERAAAYRVALDEVEQMRAEALRLDPIDLRVEYTYVVEDEDLDLDGNAIATGDDAADAAYCAALRERLRRGDEWAWCAVTVKATLQVGGETFTGASTLGACTFDDAKNFEEACYQDMKHDAAASLMECMRRGVRLGEVAEYALRSLEATTRRAEALIAEGVAVVETDRPVEAGDLVTYPDAKGRW